MNPHLQEAIETMLTATYSRSLREGATAMSQQYRRESPSNSFVLQTHDQYLAYLAVRQPATYAAAHKVISQLTRHLPQGSCFERVLDVGSGPGTALWALRDWYSWKGATALEMQRTWISIAQKLWAHQPQKLPIQWLPGDIQTHTLAKDSYDLIVASYCLNELPTVLLTQVVRNLWKATSQYLIWIEPARQDCFDKMLMLRQQLIQTAGAYVLAPCTGQGACPFHSIDTYPETGPGWCHFSVRLPRMRLHRDAKQASRGYEDEKYCYLILSKTAPVSNSQRRVVQAPSVHSGHVRMHLCDSHSLNEKVFTRSHKELFQRAKKAHWGDLWDENIDVNEATSTHTADDLATDNRE